MKDRIRTILELLKEQKIATSTVEKELGFSNGLLAKAKDTGGLSEEKFEQLQKYADLKLNGINQTPLTTETVKKSSHQMVVKSSGSLSLAPSPEVLKKIQDVMDKINKDYGEGSIMRLGDKPRTGIEIIPTGSLSLNKALGIGGLPKGRITEIYGPESSGKTTVALHIIAEAQKLGGLCAFIDVEHAFDESYAKAIGINTDILHLSQPDYGEQALEEVDRLILTGGFSVVVIDSVAALVPKGELEGEMGDSKMGLQARLMSQACRKLTGTISKTNTVCIFINQLRSTIGNMYVFEVTTGGNALKYYSSVRLEVRKSGKILDGEEQLGCRTKVKVVKNKCAPPFKIAEFDILFGIGIDGLGELIDAAVDSGIINKSGSWYSYNEIKLGQGKDTAKQIIADNEELKTEIQMKLSIAQSNSKL